MKREILVMTIAAIFTLSLVLVGSADDEVAARTVPTDYVNPGEELTVTIELPIIGVPGLVVETLCDGWSYTNTSLEPYQVAESGNTITFTLVDNTSFTYTVQAPDTEDVCCMIQGFFKDLDKVNHDFEDDFVCTYSDAQPTLIRTVPTDCVDRNTQFTVTVESPGIGLVIETLCDNWTYVSSSLEPYQVAESGNTITFTLIDDTNFTYTVQAPDTEDVCCTIQGIFKGMDKVDHDFEDDSVCTCVDIPPTDTPEPGPTEIPEFPTLLLPVTAILGLMFWFTRKK